MNPEDYDRLHKLLDLSPREVHRKKRLDETYPNYVDKHGSFLSKDDWKPHDLPIKGTTVLACGCGIPWVTDHAKDKTAVLCVDHGITTIQEIR